MAAPRGLPLGRRAGVEQNIPGASGRGGRCGREASRGSLSLGTMSSLATSSVKAPGIPAQHFRRPSSSPARSPDPASHSIVNCEHTQTDRTRAHSGVPEGGATAWELESACMTPPANFSAGSCAPMQGQTLMPYPRPWAHHIGVQDARAHTRPGLRHWPLILRATHTMAPTPCAHLRRGTL